MLRDRMVQTCVLAAVLVVLAGLFLPAPPDPWRAAQVEENRFYIDKTFHDATYDIVVLGDSRALRAVAPAEMAEILGDASVFNLAYNAGGLNREMYEAGERYLDLGSPRPAVVLAVTPLTLLDWKSANGEYRQFRNTPRDEVFLKRRFPNVAEFFAPVEPSDLASRLFRIPPKAYYYQTFHADGWIESSKVPVDTMIALHDYRETLQGSAIDSALVHDMVAQIRRWGAEGVAVFAFRPPTQASMVALEDSLLGFDEAALAREVTAGGGHWLDFSVASYHTYDGSHLEAVSARLFSRHLALAMRAAWPEVGVSSTSQAAVGNN